MVKFLNRVIAEEVPFKTINSGMDPAWRVSIHVPQRSHGGYIPPLLFSTNSATLIIIRKFFRGEANCSVWCINMPPTLEMILRLRLYKKTFFNTYYNDINSHKTLLPLPIAGVLPAPLPLREDLAGEDLLSPPTSPANSSCPTEFTSSTWSTTISSSHWRSCWVPSPKMFCSCNQTSCRRHQEWCPPRRVGKQTLRMLRFLRSSFLPLTILLILVLKKNAEN